MNESRLMRRNYGSIALNGINTVAMSDGLCCSCSRPDLRVKCTVTVTPRPAPAACFMCARRPERRRFISRTRRVWKTRDETSGQSTVQRCSPHERSDMREFCTITEITVSHLWGALHNSDPISSSASSQWTSTTSPLCIRTVWTKHPCQTSIPSHRSDTREFGSPYRS
jgi:hypothetical protein